MSHLRKMMLEEIERRNFSESTKECYIRAVEDFAAYFNRPPDQLGPEHIREFQAHLFTKRRLAPNTVNQRLAALRFFFVKTLHRPWNAAETPYPKKVIHLPIVLSQQDVALLIDSAVLPFHHAVLMTLYATGVRRAELAHLKVNDIDSDRMIVRVRGGKGRKDREVMLSPKLLEELSLLSDIPFRLIGPRPSSTEKTIFASSRMIAPHQAGASACPPTQYAGRWLCPSFRAGVAVDHAAAVSSDLVEKMRAFHVCTQALRMSSHVVRLAWIVIEKAILPVL